MPDEEQTEAINFEGPEIPGDPCPFASVAISMLSKEGSHKYFAVGMRLAEVLEMDITFVGRDHRNEIRHLYEATVKPGMKSPHPVNVGDLALLACYILEGRDKTEAIMTKKKKHKNVQGISLKETYFLARPSRKVCNVQTGMENAPRKCRHTLSWTPWPVCL